MKRKIFLICILIIFMCVNIVSASELDNSTADIETASDDNVNPTIIANDLTKYYKNDSQFEVSVFDENSTPLTDGSVDFTINGNTYKRQVDNGTAKLNINLGPGVYQITSKNCYDNSTIQNTITVLTSILSEDLTKYYRNESQFYTTILDGEGNPQADVNISININGVFYNRTTNKNGTAKLNINLSPGKYISTTERKDTGLKVSNTVTVLSNMFCYDLTKYYKNASYATAKVLDNQGNPLKNANVSFNINGVFYIRESDDDGNVRLNINLAPGEYILTAENPNSTLKQSSRIKVLPKMTEESSYFCYSRKNTYDVKLLNDVGSPDAGKIVNFNINGQIFKVKTDSQGMAKCPLGTLKNGAYTITAEYDGNMVSNGINIGPGSVSVIRNIGNPSAKKIAYVVGVHPLEHETHDTLVKLLPTIPGFNYCYDIYVINVVENVGYYGDGAGDNSPGRQNGQNLAYNYVYPQIVNGGYELAIDVHSNVGAYPYRTFVFSPVTGGLGEQYGRAVAKTCANVVYYQLGHTTSGPYLTVPLNNHGVPAFYFEEYSFASQAQKDTHMMQLIFGVDGLKL
ncbi:MAG: hypothetical protein IJQ68_01940 [Methanobrevibacter sp.]|uniref:hypothetical protein n=1 Tax=Methanobrevibacter sp. TaxID=66852 RepID=UPI0025FF0802|nr:hypothetical protein [Methanobrevibacter sp.]MBR0270742.1 hypothetical protein [Methanobrevibacter sp.]